MMEFFFFLLCVLAVERGFQLGAQTRYPPAKARRSKSGRGGNAVCTLAVHRFLRRLRHRLHVQEVRTCLREKSLCGPAISLFVYVDRFNSHRQLEKAITIAGIAVLAFVVCFSRVRLGYHSLEQVLAGAAVGTATGLGWHALVASVSFKHSAVLSLCLSLMCLQSSSWLFPAISSHPIAQFFYIRDISRIPDLIVHQHQICHVVGANKQL